MFFLKRPLDEQDMAPSELLDSALAELHQLIGMEPIAAEIMNLVNHVKASRLQEEDGSKRIDKNLHLVFTGNSGTGKTTVARIIGKICKASGILSEGHTVEVKRLDLVDSYGDRTAARTQTVIEAAIGGVLFIMRIKG